MHLLTKLMIGTAAGARLLASDSPIEQLLRVILYGAIAFVVLVFGFAAVVIAYVAWAVTRESPVEQVPQPITASVPWSPPAESPPAVRERQPQTVPEGATIISDDEYGTLYVMPGEKVGRQIFK